MNRNLNGKVIVVVEAGWVFLADKMEDFKVHGTLPVLKLEGCSVIRVWGTTAGLGEIALHGPTKDTVLDFAGTVDVPHSKVLSIIYCSY
jgi:hypothetical protein